VYVGDANDLDDAHDDLDNAHDDLDNAHDDLNDAHDDLNDAHDFDDSWKFFFLFCPVFYTILMEMARD
jgi:hypothetical protein